jgi:hypothetical protein
MEIVCRPCSSRPGHQPRAGPPPGSTWGPSCSRCRRPRPAGDLDASPRRTHPVQGRRDERPGAVSRSPSSTSRVSRSPATPRRSRSTPQVHVPVVRGELTFEGYDTDRGPLPDQPGPGHGWVPLTTAAAGRVDPPLRQRAVRAPRDRALRWLGEVGGQDPGGGRVHGRTSHVVRHHSHAGRTETPPPPWRAVSAGGADRLRCGSCLWSGEAPRGGGGPAGFDACGRSGGYGRSRNG